MNKQTSSLEDNDNEVIDNSGSYYHVLQHLYRNEKMVVIQTNDSLIFPANDLATLIKCKEHYLLIVNFFGLTGVDAPWWLTGVRIINRNLKICRQVISQRCYELYYLAWYHTHPLSHWVETKNTFLLSVRRLFDLAQFKYGFRQLLAAYPYRISMQSSWQTVAGIGQSGTNLCLGHNILLGERIVQANRIMRITIGPLARKELADWLSQSAMRVLINQLFADSVQTDTRLCWQCRQQPLLDDSERCLGRALIYLGF
jgi:predicted component of type VI protein secretion system